MSSRTYIVIDLKSFYASVECVDRQLAPFTTDLLVAGQARTDKTICFAVFLALKACGIPGRLRLFEVVQKAWQVAQRQRFAPQRRFTGKSANAPELAANSAFLSWTTLSPCRAWPTTLSSVHRFTTFI